MRAEMAPSSGLPGAPALRMESAFSRSRPLRSIQARPSASEATWTPQRKLLISFSFAPLPIGPEVHDLLAHRFEHGRGGFERAIAAADEERELTGRGLRSAAGDGSVEQFDAMLRGCGRRVLRSTPG